MRPRKINASHFGKDIRDFLACLSRHAVDFLLVGGEAVIFYGYPRVTGDIDIFYRLTPGNIGLAPLLRNKKAAGRPKDMDDLRFLEAARARRRRRRS